MTYRIGLVQCKHPKDGDVITMADSWLRQAADRGCALVVFPESLMTRYEESVGGFLKAAQPLDGPFTTAMDQLAADYRMHMLYTVNELSPINGAKPYNTAVLTGPDGTRLGAYRKIHLFDSSTTQESSRMSAGKRLLDPLDTPLGKLGLAICYDLRFPEVARHMALKGCQLMLYPAAWVDGKGKAQQWRTLLAARAIENGMFVAGVSRCDDGYIGCSCVCDPFGNVIAQAGTDDELLTADIDLDLVDQARASIPVLQHRHPESYELA